MTQFFSLSDLGLATSSSEYLADWLAQMTAQYPDYTASAGNLEYIQALIFASWAADCAQLASSGATELFRQFGTQLVNLAYQQGTPAVAVISVMAAATSGAPVTYTLPAGTQFTLDDLGFMSATNLTLISGTSDSVSVIAVENGTSYNGAGSGGAVQIISPYDWVAGVTLVTQAGGGIDQEDDDHYLARLVATLQTMAPRPITASDYAIMALDFTPAPSTTQQQCARATAIDGYDPAVTNFTATVKNTTTLSSVSSFTGISNGSLIGGSSYIPANSTVQSFNVGASTLVLTNAATGPASGSNQALTSTGTYGNEKEITVCGTDSGGLALSSDTMTAMKAWFQSMRQVNDVINVIAPTSNNTWVTCSVHPMTGWDQTLVAGNVQSALLNFFDPANWGLPQSSILGWQNYTTIYRSKVINVIQQAGGVDYIEALSIGATLVAPPTAPSLASTGDVVLSGPVAMPSATTVTIPTSAITFV